MRHSLAKIPNQSVHIIDTLCKMIIIKLYTITNTMQLKNVAKMIKYNSLSKRADDNLRCHRPFAVPVKFRASNACKSIY